MHSMTGHGRAQTQSEEWQITAEVHSVNRKQADVVVSLAREFSALEPKVRELVQTRMTRGRINVSLTIRKTGGHAAKPTLDREAAKAWLDEVRAFQTELGVGGEIRIQDLLAVPGVLGATGPSIDPEKLWEPLAATVETAMGDLLAMRAKEGRFLARDLLQRIKSMRDAVRRIRSRIPVSIEAYRENLRERIAAAGIAIPVDEERIAREVIFFADRSDVSEELTRLESHFAQFAQHLRSKEPVGRTLDFMTQEIGRELNTLGVKSNDAPIANEVVNCKSELERIREQVQNLE